jgi:protein-S-isoprenylcysteine O-methyltransferase Ste14
MAKPVPGPAPRWVIACGDFLFKYRNYLFPAIFVVLVLTAGRESWTSDRVDRTLDIAGVVVAALGQALRALVIGLAYIKRGGLNKKVYASDLVTTGIFASCRNPLYVGNAMILVGLLLVCNTLPGYLIAGGFFIFAYWCIVRTEETFLLNKFGEEYAEYCRNVNRWIPDLGRVIEAMRTMSFNWRRVVMKDYSTIVTWVLGIIALQTYEEALRGAGLTQGLVIGFAVQVGFVLCCSATVRWLKKSGRLTETAQT